MRMVSSECLVIPLIGNEKMQRMRNVSEMSEGVCTGCGTCSGVCPSDAVTMTRNRQGRYVPSVDEETCTRCRLCVRSCPGLHLSVPTNSTQAVIQSVGEGAEMRYYLGYSTDPSVRHRSSSGGVLTEFASELLETGRVQGVATSRMREDRPLEPESIVSTSREDLMGCVGSIYSPVPLNTVLRNLEKMDGEIAVVGLPCHLRGLDKAQSVRPVLNSRVSMKIGLFCGGCPTANATDMLLHMRGIKDEEVEGIKYRGDGWPGFLSIETKDGRTNRTPYPDYFFGVRSAFMPTRCRLCLDLFSPHADISFGDAWLEDVQRNDRDGTSIIICRSREARGVLEELRDSGRISLVETSLSCILESQKYHGYKQRHLSSNLRIHGAQNHDFENQGEQRVRLREYVPMYLLNLIGGGNPVRGRYATIRMLITCARFGQRLRSAFKE